MYINEVISHRGAWSKLKENHSEEYSDIINAIDFDIYTLDFNTILDRSRTRAGRALATLSFEQMIRNAIEYNFENLGWHAKGAVFQKNSCSFRLFGMPSQFLWKWLYQDILVGITNKNGIDIPILITNNFSDIKLENIPRFFQTNNSAMRIRDFSTCLRNLKNVSPLKFEHPFLILSIGLEEEAIIIHEIETYQSDEVVESRIISQCITFEPEYYQAGVGILSYFGTVLREKYPEQNATVKIEQQDLTVRMIVESENGDKEVIEKALHEYELVISGQTPVEDFYPTAIQTLELKNKIRMLNYELETQREISALKDGVILDLRALAHQALSQPQSNITVINQLHNEQNIKIDYKAEINQSYEVIDKLIDLLSDESIKNQLRDIQNALDNTKEKKTPEEVKDSSGFKKLGKFLKEAKDVSSNIHGVLDNTEKGLGLIEKLAKHYDKLVQFAQPFFS